MSSPLAGLNVQSTINTILTIQSFFTKSSSPCPKPKPKRATRSSSLDVNFTARSTSTFEPSSPPPPYEQVATAMGGQEDLVMREETEEERKVRLLVEADRRMELELRRMGF